MSVDFVAPGASLEHKFSIAAQAIFDVLKQKAEDEPLVVGLCGGRSVVGLVKALRDESAHQPKTLFQRVQFFMVDERVVPLSDPQSNFGGLKSLLFDDLKREGFIREEQLHPFVATMDSAQNACADYMNTLRKFGGYFSVVVLGMGEDGHVAGLFPRHPVLSQNALGFAAFADSPKPPPQRMTASLPLVTASSLGVLLALGEGKRDAWTTFKKSGVTVDECPARAVLSMSRCLILTDLE